MTVSVIQRQQVISAFMRGKSIMSIVKSTMEFDYNELFSDGLLRAMAGKCNDGMDLDERDIHLSRIYNYTFSYILKHFGLTVRCEHLPNNIRETLFSPHFIIESYQKLQDMNEAYSLPTMVGVKFISDDKVIHAFDECSVHLNGHELW